MTLAVMASIALPPREQAQRDSRPFLSRLVIFPLVRSPPTTTAGDTRREKQSGSDGEDVGDDKPAVLEANVADEGYERLIKAVCRTSRVSQTSEGSRERKEIRTLYGSGRVEMRMIPDPFGFWARKEAVDNANYGY